LPENATLSTPPSLLAIFQRELLMRVRGLEALKRQGKSLEDDYRTAKVDYVDYEARTTKLGAEIERLKSGDVQHQRTPITEWKTVADSQPARLHLVKPYTPYTLALTTGPETTWWRNGVTATRIAFFLTLVPLVYATYSVIPHAWNDAKEGYGFWAFLLAGIAHQFAYWLVIAFVMGSLYPYLYGHNGVWKGVALAVIYAAAVLPTNLVAIRFKSQDPGRTVINIMLLVVFLITLGVALDWRTLRLQGLPPSSLIDYYQLRSLGAIVGYLSPLVIAILTIISLLHSGNIMDAITQTIKALPGALPTQSK
jgi:hypothetical protein